MALREPFTFETRIRFIDTDASGRIHYTSMFRYFESAETELLRTIGVGFLKYEFTFPRVHVECDFKLALTHDDPIVIEIRLAKLGRSSLRYDFRTLKDGALAAKGTVVVACMDRKTQRSVPIPDELRRKLQVIAEDSGEEGTPTPE